MDFFEKYDFCAVSCMINIQFHINRMQYVINHIYMYIINGCTTFLLILFGTISVRHIFHIFCTTDRPKLAQCIKMYYARVRTYSIEESVTYVTYVYAYVHMLRKRISISKRSPENCVHPAISNMTLLVNRVLTRFCLKILR